MSEKLAHADGGARCCDRILDGAVHMDTGLLCADIGNALEKSFETKKHWTQKNPVFFSRSDRIRTCGLCVPNAALYQTEPRFVNLYKPLNRDCKSYYIDFCRVCQDINVSFFEKFAVVIFVPVVNGENIQ